MAAPSRRGPLSRRLSPAHAQDGGMVMIDDDLGMSAARLPGHAGSSQRTRKRPLKPCGGQLPRLPKCLLFTSHFTAVMKSHSLSHGACRLLWTSCAVSAVNNQGS